MTHESSSYLFIGRIMIRFSKRVGSSIHYLKALAVSEVHAVGAHHGLAEALVGQVGVVVRVGVVEVEDCLALAIDLHCIALK